MTEVIDLTQTTQPKSDQLNADDLLGGQTLTIKVTAVKLLGGDQPIAIHYEGDNGKPYKPGKSMRRVLVHVWGHDGTAYVGRYMTLYRDPDVMFGGVKVGGIRISHMSHMKEQSVMALTVTRGSKKAFVVKPLTPPAQGAAAPQPTISAEEVAAMQKAAEAEADKGIESLKAHWSSIGGQKQKALGGAEGLGKLKERAQKADAAKAQQNSSPQTTSGGDDDETPFDV